MPAAPQRLVPSPDVLRVLRQLICSSSSSISTGNIWYRNKKSCCRWQHASAQKGIDHTQGDEENSAKGSRHSSVSLANNSGHGKGWQSLNNKVRFRDTNVDEAAERQSTTPEQWLATVSQQDRLKGRHGVRTVLQQMRKQLRTNGAHSLVHNTLPGRFWSILSKYSTLHEEVIDFAIEVRERSGLQHSHLWRKIIASNLKGAPSETLQLHNRMRLNGITNDGQLARLGQQVPLNSACLAVFREIYLSSTDRDCYDILIQRLTKAGLHDQAVSWHKLLVEQGDLPSNDMKKHPFVRQIEIGGLSKATGNSIQALGRVSVASGEKVAETQTKLQSISPVPQPNSPRLTREIMSRILGDVHGVTPLDISDRLCARFFATAAFPVDFVITGLAAFGVNEIGPLAFRQLALRCETTTELLDKVRRIKEARLTVHPGVFCTAILRLANESREVLLRNLLSSDQHPDVIADKATQIRLLKKHVKERDWPSAHWTLYVLTHFHSEKSNEAWDHLVQYHAKESDWTTFSAVLDDVLANSVWISQTTISQILKCRLRARRPAHAPIMLPDAPDELLHLTNFMRGLLKIGYIPTPTLWSELIRRFGKTNRWDELSRLLLWLAQKYSPYSVVTSAVDQSIPAEHSLQQRRFNRWHMNKARERTYTPTDQRHPLQQLFPLAMQRAIVDWGFKSGYHDLEKFFHRRLQDDAKKNGLDTYSFRSGCQYKELFSKISNDMPGPENYPLRGLILLRQLQDQGVHVDAATVRQAAKNRLWLLYGPGGISNVKGNRRARMINPWTFEEMLGGIQRITGISRSKFEKTVTVMGEDESTSDLSELPNDLVFSHAIQGSSCPAPSQQREPNPPLVPPGSDNETLHNIFNDTAAEALQDIILAKFTRLQRGLHYRPLLDESSAPDTSQRAELQRRVRLAISFFGPGRPMYGSRPDAQRMTVPMYVNLVKTWAHQRLKRKLGISGALARPRKGYGYEWGGRLRRSAWRTNTQTLKSKEEVGHSLAK